MGYHHGNLRSACIQEGSRLISEGQMDFSLRDIAKNLEVSPGAPYRHFKSKEELYAEIAAEGFRKFIDKLEEAKSAKSNEEYFYGVGQRYLEFAMNYPNHYRLMFTGMIPGHTEYEELDEAGKKAFGLLLEMVQSLQRSKYIVEENPLTLAFFIWSGIHGLANFLIDNRLEAMEDSKNLSQYSTESLEEWKEKLIPNLIGLTLRGIIRNPEDTSRG
jgi:AcrR family transcriptional regulator